jgi:hypothetical protein
MFEREFLLPLRESLKVTRLKYLSMQEDNKKEMITSRKYNLAKHFRTVFADFGNCDVTPRLFNN